MIFSHLGEEDFVVGFEATLECLLEPEREYDQPRIIRVATRENAGELEGANIGDVSGNVQWQKLHAELAGRICTTTGKCQRSSMRWVGISAGLAHRNGPNLVRSAPPTPGDSSTAAGRALRSLPGSRSTDSDHWARWDQRTLLDGTCSRSGRVTCKR